MPETLIGIFLDAVASWARPALFLRKTPSGTWEELSPARARADVEALAHGLRALGVQPGEKVVLIAETRYEWAVTDLAILGSGAVTVPIYPTLTARQVRALVEHSESQVAVVSNQAQLDKIHAAIREGTMLRAVVYMDPCPGAAPTDVSWRSLHERGAAARAAAPGAFAEWAARVQPEDVATIIYTSGTTGDPKGAMLTHRNIAFDVHASLQAIEYLATDTALSWLPLCHVFERMAGLYAALAGRVRIAYAESFDTVAADAVAVRPTVMMGVPRFYEKVYSRVMEASQSHPAPVKALFGWGLGVGRRVARLRFAGKRPGPVLALQARLADRLVFAKIRARVGGRLRFCVSGSAPLSTEVIEFFFAIGIPVVEGYGLTETSPVICVNRLGRERPGSVGPPIPGVEVKIGAEGEILTRGPHVMKGYYRNEAATHDAVRDGWFHTGDVGRLDAEGCLFITDRLKDLLVLAGGKKVSPQPIEARLKLSPWVSEAVLIGDRRPFVVALLIPDFARLEAEAQARGWSFASRRELLARPETRGLYQGEVDRLNADLAGFEKIKRFELLETEFSQEGGELTPSLKVKRKVVLERHGPVIERLFEGHAQPR